MMFGLSTFELLSVVSVVGSFILGAVFWAGKVYQRITDGVELLRRLVAQHNHLEIRVTRIETELDLPPIPLAIIKPNDDRPGQ